MYFEDPKAEPWETQQIKRQTGHVERDIVGDFFSEIHKHYSGENRFVECEYFNNSDNNLSCLIVDNKMVAFVIERRNAFNNIEFTLSKKPY